MRRVSNYDVQRIRSLRSNGAATRSIAKNVGISKSSVATYSKDVKASHNVSKSGRPSILSNRLKGLILRRHVACLAMSTTDTQKYLTETCNVNVSRQTIMRVLQRGGLVARVRSLKPRLTSIHKKNRLNWASAMADVANNFWDGVIFTDESKYNLYGPDGHKQVWRYPGAPTLPEHFRYTVKFGGGSVMVWGAITAYGVGKLVFIDKIMDANMFVAILKFGFTTTLEMYNLLVDNVYLQMDNDPKHTSKIAKNALSECHIECLPWPSCSPDMNPIEHVWNDVNLRLRKRKIQPKNIAELKVAIEEEWYATSVEYIRTLYDSMIHRVAAVIKAKGGSTKY